MARAGASKAEADKILADAKAVDQAGAFCIVVEGVLEDIATEVTRSGRGAGDRHRRLGPCDGQVLVTEDMLGLFERTPRFVKRYDDLAARIGEAAATYAGEVRARSLPDRRPDLPAERRLGSLVRMSAFNSKADAQGTMPQDGQVRTVPCNPW